MKDANNNATLMHYTNQPGTFPSYPPHCADIVTAVVLRKVPAFDLNLNFHVPNASYQDRLDQPWSEHKFDWTTDSVKFYQNNALKKEIIVNTPRDVRAQPPLRFVLRLRS